MNIYLISQDVNNEYDTYDSAVVAAVNEYEAKRTYPSPFRIFVEDVLYFNYGDSISSQEVSSGDWTSNPNDVDVELIGTTTKEAGVILASFNAG